MSKKFIEIDWDNINADEISALITELRTTDLDLTEKSYEKLWDFTSDTLQDSHLTLLERAKSDTPILAVRFLLELLRKETESEDKGKKELLLILLHDFAEYLEVIPLYFSEGEKMLFLQKWANRIIDEVWQGMEIYIKLLDFPSYLIVEAAGDLIGVLYRARPEEYLRKFDE